YTQLSLGYTANGAGGDLFIYFWGVAPPAQGGGRLLDRRGAELPVLLGGLIGAVGEGVWGWRLPRVGLGHQGAVLVLAGPGVGLLLGPSRTDAVNRAIDASYGEVTGITQTIRNYGSSLGLAVLGAVLLSQMTTRVTDTLVGLGVPADRAGGVAKALSE